MLGKRSLAVAMSAGIPYTRLADLNLLYVARAMHEVLPF
jgi:hypothetical protein